MFCRQPPAVEDRDDPPPLRGCAFGSQCRLRPLFPAEGDHKLQYLLHLSYICRMKPNKQS